MGLGLYKKVNTNSYTSLYMSVSVVRDHPENNVRDERPDFLCESFFIADK